MALKYRVITMSLLLGLGLIVSFNAHADSIEETKIKFFNDEILKKITTVCNAIAKTKKIDFVNQLIQSNDIELVEANTTYYVFKSSAILAQNNRERIKNEINKDCKAANDKAFADAEARRQAALQGASSPSGSGSTSSGSSGSSSAGGIGGSGLGINDVFKAGKALERLEKANQVRKNENIKAGENLNSQGNNNSTSSAKDKGVEGSAASQNTSNGINDAVVPTQVSAINSVSSNLDDNSINSTIGVDISQLSQKDLESYNALKEEANKAVESAKLESDKLTKESQDSANKALSKNGSDVIDDKAKKKLLEDQQAIDLLTKKIDDLLNTLQPISESLIKIQPVACTPPTPMSPNLLFPHCTQITQINLDLKKLIPDLLSYKTDQNSLQTKCSSNATRTDNFCSWFRSPNAIFAQQVLSFGLTALSSTTSASKTCGLTSSISKVAQGGLLIAQLTCSGFNMACDSICGRATKNLIDLQAVNLEIFGIAAKIITIAPIAGWGIEIQKAAIFLKTELTAHTIPDKGLVPSSVTLCQKHKASIITMGTQIAGLALAANDAKTCKNKLSSGSDSGDDGKKAVTTAEFCRLPENVNTVSCKCFLNPNDSVCAIRAITDAQNNKANQADAGDRPNGFLGGRTGTNSGVSAFAGSSNGSDGSSDNAVVGKNKNDGSESSASSNLNNSGAVSALSGSSLLSGSDNQAGGSSAGTGSSGSSSSSKDKNSSDELARGNNTTTSGFSFSALKSSLGSFFGSGSAPAKKPVKISESRQKELEQAVKRKIASEQFRSEVTTANGNSNFEKVSNKYRSQQQSFLNEE